jgi:type IV fimbrial biogenesis protein FimT
MNRQKNAGFTLLESMVVVAIAGILAAIAVLSFSDMMMQQRVEGAAEGMVAALQNAKAEAIKRNAFVGIAFMPATTGTDLSVWCYGMTPPAATAAAATCDCTAGDCAQGSVVQNTDFSGITVNFNQSDSRIFNPLRGTTGNSGTIRFSAGNNKTLGVTTTSLGRIRICKDTASTIGSYSDSGSCS